MDAALTDAMFADGRWKIGDNGVVIPMADLVDSVTSALHQSDGGPGYAAINGLESELGLERSKSFQVNLVEAIWAEMIRRHLNPYPPDAARLNRFEANDGHLPPEIVGDTVTFKKLHFDPHSIFFAHLYEAAENLSGGVISMVDVRRYLSDTGLVIGDVFRPLNRFGHDGRLVARDEHRPLMLNSYAHRIDPPGVGRLLLLIVRNDASVGVAHEIEHVRVIDPSRQSARRFVRVSIAPHH